MINIPMSCGSFAHTHICVLYIFQGKKEEEEEEQEKKERNWKPATTMTGSTAFGCFFLLLLACLLLFYFVLDLKDYICTREKPPSLLSFITSAQALAPSPPSWAFSSSASNPVILCMCV